MKKKTNRLYNKKKRNTKKRKGGSVFGEIFNFRKTPEQTPELPPDFRDNAGERSISVYYVYGMGCDNNIETNVRDKRFCVKNNGEDCSNMANIYENSNIKKRKSEYSLKLGLPEENIKIVCDTIGKAITNILTLWAKSKTPFGEYFYNLPLEQSNNYLILLNSVISDINRGKRVFIYGHSFGGAIVNRLATSLQNYALSDKSFEDKLKTKLLIVAFAGIYVATEYKVDKINIMNIISLGDVAIRLNGLYEPDYSSNFNKVPNYQFVKSKVNPTVIWMEQPYDSNKGRRHVDSYTNNSSLMTYILGKESEWAIHNRYYYMRNKYDSEIKRQTGYTKNNEGDIIESLNDINIDSFKQALFGKVNIKLEV